MNIKRIVLLSTIFVLITSPAFSQSKLQGAGNASKVKTSAPARKRSVPQKTVATSYAAIGYMRILDVSFANTDANKAVVDDFNSKLFAKEVKYLTPRIKYNGLCNEEKTVNLKVKVYDEEGILSRSSGSVDNFSYSQDISVEPGTNNTVDLLGWGASKGGTFKAGLYKFEVWYNQKMLVQKEIRLYSGATPVVQSSILSISNVVFANEDKNGNVINGYGQMLVSGQVKYLKPKISYNGKFTNDQEVSLYVRLFDAAGNLVRGSKSPEGFSYKENVTIKKGYNSVVLTGYGNEAATTFTEGDCIAELWLDGEKIYETTVKICKPGSTYSYGGGISSAVNEFFPLWGITLGKTTWQDAENLGLTVKLYDNKGPDRYTYLNDVAFWDHDASGKFTQIYWTHHDEDFPKSWKNKGFSWDNSYNDWLTTFRKLGYTIKVTKEPVTRKYSGRNTLSADVKVVSPDGSLAFDLDFDYGESGHYTSSPKSLYSITIRYLPR